MFDTPGAGNGSEVSPMRNDSAAFVFIFVSAPVQLTAEKPPRPIRCARRRWLFFTLLAAIANTGCEHRHNDEPLELSDPLPPRPVVFPFGGKVTVDGRPPSEPGTVFVAVVPRGMMRRVEDCAVRCQTDGTFNCSTYSAGDGLPPNEYVIVFAKLAKSGKRYAGPDQFNNLYNDPIINASNPDFVVNHMSPGKSDYVFNLAIKERVPNSRPSRRALTELDW